MSTLIIQKHMTLVSNSKTKISQNHNMYEAVYHALIHISQQRFAIPRYRFSFSKNVQNVAINNGLLSNTTEEATLLGRKHKDVEYYKISEKGLRYIKLYEALHEMVIK